MASNYDYTFKVLTIGSSAVGKTSIIVRITEDKFYGTNMSTVGIDFKTTDVVIDNKTVQVKIWDTAGQEKFQNLTQQYYKNAHGILLVFDVNYRDTFEKVSEWMNDITKGNKGGTKIVLIGNKIDVPSRSVSYEEGKAKAKEYDIPYYETSAKTGENTREMFDGLIKELMHSQPANEKEAKSIEFDCSVHLKIDKKKEKRKCC